MKIKLLALVSLITITSIFAELSTEEQFELADQAKKPNGKAIVSQKLSTHVANGKLARNEADALKKNYESYPTESQEMPTQEVFAEEEMMVE